jgi:hypothetical protein
MDSLPQEQSQHAEESKISQAVVQEGRRRKQEGKRVTAEDTSKHQPDYEPTTIPSTGALESLPIASPGVRCHQKFVSTCSPFGFRSICRGRKSVETQGRKRPRRLSSM